MGSAGSDSLVGQVPLLIQRVIGKLPCLQEAVPDHGDTSVTSVILGQNGIKFIWEIFPFPRIGFLSDPPPPRLE
jgi:hypothetical protein